MKKVLFVGVERSFLRHITCQLMNNGKQFIFFFANNSADVQNRCLENPDIKIVVLIGYIFGIQIHPDMVKTATLVQKIREGLGDGVKIITASPDQEINTCLMKVGCDEEIPLYDLTERLTELL